MDLRQLETDILAFVRRGYPNIEVRVEPWTADPSRPAHGDYRQARTTLLARGFREDELFDVFHVLMARGGYCDCEILYNAAEASRLKTEYWQARAEEIEPYDPHAGPGGSTP